MMFAKVFRDEEMNVLFKYFISPFANTVHQAEQAGSGIPKRTSCSLELKALGTGAAWVFKRTTVA